jgi:ATP-dependent helicase/nuclease subunit A
MSGEVHPLQGPQRQAVDPLESVWLSASAGTGKTQVLSARVLRLLLQDGVSPSQILCLTFTKAGAAEMATRINEVLARWVRLEDTRLNAELDHIGAAGTPENRARARTLFAAVLDCPGGGLRIDTIHAFSQWLLSAFPEEAGLTPGTRAMEDRDRELLARDTLAQMLVEAEAQGDADTLETIARLSRRLGPDAVQAWLMRCADARAAWFGPGAWTPPLRERVNQLLGLESDADEASVVALCADAAFDVRSLRRCLETHAAWDSATGRAAVQAIGDWLAGGEGERLELLDTLYKCLFTQDGRPKQLENILKRDPHYEEPVLAVLESVLAIRRRRMLLELAGWLTPALTLGRKFALAWDAAKAREGFIDFDDQIRQAAALLARPGMGDWIRYKLDRRFDHLLIDEAQDTNAAQWSIVEALTGDFFTGLGARDEALRTVFVVGDYKQAIFRFQGTSPENFEAARRRFKTAMDEAAANAAALRDPRIRARTLKELGLDRSYRTAQDVLDFVDAALQSIGAESIGLRESLQPHKGDESRPGLVALWPPVGGAEDDEEADEGQESWLSRPDRVLADRIARQVWQWTMGEHRLPLHKGEKRLAEPRDVMILVRKRRDLAGLIVARLHARGVPVAGVDRLRLGAPLAVKDLMAALRFAVQPLDDLTLANLLVSPLIGWTQEDLLEHAFRPRDMRLWDHLRDARAPAVVATAGKLRDLLRRADFEPPQALLHWILTGPWRGRRELVRRLGSEANDPIDEMLNAALAYAGAHTPSLAGFIRWFDAGEGELKREAGASEGMVRVMTVHGAKGLQAPIVVLADAALRPGGAAGGIEVGEPSFAGATSLFDPRTLPLPRLRKDEIAGRVAEAAEKAAAEELQEHWRLLYVAMTRAEEALFVAGSLGARDKEPPPDSWYARLEPLFPGDWKEVPIWKRQKNHGSLGELARDARTQPATPAAALPTWAATPIGPEPRPPRPLAPSSAGQDDSADPPLPPGADSFAARRGVLIHKLLERLPELAPGEREKRAREWLARQAVDVDEPEREAMVAAALAVLAQAGWAEIFSPAALAEVPLAATVGGQVIAGTADRLLVEPDRVLVVDFKTARRPPSGLNEVALTTLRQMAAYVAALEAIYPGRRVEAAVLYTQTPLLVPIPADVLAGHKAALANAEESFAR